MTPFLRTSLQATLSILIFLVSLELLTFLALRGGLQTRELWDPNDHKLPSKSKKGRLELKSIAGESDSLLKPKDVPPAREPLSCSEWTLFEHFKRGYQIVRANHVQHHRCETKGGELLFAVEESTDEHRFRRVANPPPQATRHLLTVGCSFLFGHGLRDEETLASQLQSLWPDTRVYNPSRPGGSVADALVALEHVGNWQSLSPQRGLALVYFSPSLHLPRLYPSLSQTLRWNEYGAAMVWHPALGRFVWEGTWSTSRLWVRALSWLKSSSLFQLMNPEWPWRWRTEHFVGYAKALAQMRELYQGLYPETDFVVFTQPQERIPQVFFGTLDELGLPYLDYGSLTDQNFPDKAMRLPFDGHPNQDWHRELAGLLSQDLSLPENQKVLRHFFKPGKTD